MLPRGMTWNANRLCQSSARRAGAGELWQKGGATNGAEELALGLPQDGACAQAQPHNAAPDAKALRRALTWALEGLDGVDGVCAVRVDGEPQVQLPQRLEVQRHDDARVRLCRGAVVHQRVQYLLPGRRTGR